LGDLVQMTATFSFIKSHDPDLSVLCARLSPICHRIVEDHPCLDGSLPYRVPTNHTAGLLGMARAYQTNYHTLRQAGEAFFAFPPSQWGMSTTVPLRVSGTACGSMPWLGAEDFADDAVPIHLSYQLSYARWKGIEVRQLFEPSVSLTEAEADEGNGFWAGHFPPGKPRAIVVYDAGTPLKSLPAEVAAEFCNLLMSAGYVTVILQGKNAPDTVWTIAERVRTGVKVYAYRPDLPRLKRLIAGCDLVVSPDTGIAHLAAALGVRVIVLFGPSSVVFRPAGDRTVVVRKSAECKQRGNPPCWVTGCRHSDYGSAGGEPAVCMRQFERSDLERALSTLTIPRAAGRRDRGQ
jgi:hypothetical protein